MDANRFDDLVRAASARGSRRGVLRVLAGVALGSLGLGVWDDAGAARCPRGKERCGGKCRAKCPDVMTRNRRTCRCECPDGMRACGRVCVDQDTCCPGEKTCGGGCIREDACCPHTHRECANGACIDKEACCPGTDACPADPGGCCQPGETCSDDGCCLTAGSQEVCGGRCVDTDTDPNHCGLCNKTCDPCQRCVGGQCKSTCGIGQECCNGTCVPVGSCCNGVACDPRTEACSPEGQCVDYCTLNDAPYTVPCDNGVRHWCCPTRSPVCCERGGQPYCC